MYTMRMLSFKPCLCAIVSLPHSLHSFSTAFRLLGETGAQEGAARAQPDDYRTNGTIFDHDVEREELERITGITEEQKQGMLSHRAALRLDKFKGHDLIALKEHTDSQDSPSAPPPDDSDDDPDYLITVSSGDERAASQRSPKRARVVKDAKKGAGKSRGKGPAKKSKKRTQKKAKKSATAASEEEWSATSDEEYEPVAITGVLDQTAGRPALEDSSDDDDQVPEELDTQVVEVDEDTQELDIKTLPGHQQCGSHVLHHVPADVEKCLAKAEPVGKLVHFNRGMAKLKVLWRAKRKSSLVSIPPHARGV